MSYHQLTALRTKLNEGDRRCYELVQAAEAKGVSLSAEAKEYIDQWQGIDDEPGLRDDLLEDIKRAETMERKIVSSGAFKSLESKTHATTAKQLRSGNGSASCFVFNKGDSVADAYPESRDMGPYAFGELIVAKACGAHHAPHYVKNAMKQLDNTSGGFLVPNGFSSMFLDLARNQMTIMRAGATMMTMDTADMTIAKVDADPTPYVKPEMELATASDITFGAARLDAQTVMVYMTASRELIEDSPNAAQLIVDVGSQALATKVDEWALVGNSSSFTGLTDNSSIHATTSVGAIDWLDFSEASTLCRLANYEPKAAILNPRIYDDLHTIPTGDGTNSSKGWLPRPESIKDLAFLPTNSCPLAYSVVGDFAPLLWGVRTQPTVEVSTQAGEMFQRHGVAIKIFWRGDFVLTRPTSLERLTGITS